MLDILSGAEPLIMDVRQSGGSPVRLRDDAVGRSWNGEADRHNRVIDSLETHLNRLKRDAARQADG
jgi:hypothetical protein